MPTCSNCGATVRESARFCTSCGTRLNEPTESTTSHWPSAAESSASDASSPVVETSVWEAIRQEVVSASGERTATTATQSEPEDTTDTGLEASQDEEAVNEEAFTWTWNTQAPADDERDGDDVAPPVDDESSVVIDSDEPSQEVDEPTDFTELEIVDDSPEVSDVVAGEEGISTGESADEEPAPDTPELDDVLTSPDDEIEDQETLAAWATQWNTPVLSAAAVDEAPASDGPTVRADDDEEDTIAKAERLIGELQSIIPTLARPKPAQPVFSRDPHTLATELDDAANLGAWDDLRQVLLSARENPRDIDNMLNLAANVDQMFELLNDRDNLAKTATNVAAQLREPSDRSSEL